MLRVTDDLEAGGLGELGSALENDALAIPNAYMCLAALAHPVNMALAMPNGKTAAILGPGTKRKLWKLPVAACMCEALHITILFILYMAL